MSFGVLRMDMENRPASEGKFDFTWPSLNIVDLPPEPRVYQPNAEDQLPTLLSAQVLNSKDPRQRLVASQGSVYSGSAECAKKVGEEDWYLEDASKDFPKGGGSPHLTIHIKNPRYTGPQPDVDMTKRIEKTGVAKGKRSKDASAADFDPAQKVDSWIQAQDFFSQEDNNMEPGDYCGLDASSGGQREPKKEDGVQNKKSDIKPSDIPQPESPDQQEHTAKEGSGENMLRMDASNISGKFDQRPTSPKHIRACSPSLQTTLRPLSQFSCQALAGSKEFPDLDDMMETTASKVSACLDAWCDDQSDGWVVEDYSHLPALSIESQLLGACADSSLVRREHMLAMQNWYQQSPLDSLMLGKLNPSRVKIPKVAVSQLTDATVQTCLDSFDSETRQMISTPSPQGGIFTHPCSQTEDNVNSVFNQVVNYIGFLVDGSMHGSESGELHNHTEHRQSPNSHTRNVPCQNDGSVEARKREKPVENLKADKEKSPQDIKMEKCHKAYCNVNDSVHRMLSSFYSNIDILLNTHKCSQLSGQDRDELTLEDTIDLKKHTKIAEMLLRRRKRSSSHKDKFDFTFETSAPVSVNKVGKENVARKPSFTEKKGKELDMQNGDVGYGGKRVKDLNRNNSSSKDKDDAQSSSAMYDPFEPTEECAIEEAACVHSSVNTTRNSSDEEMKTSKEKKKKKKHKRHKNKDRERKSSTPKGHTPPPIGDTGEEKKSKRGKEKKRHKEKSSRSRSRSPKKAKSRTPLAQVPVPFASLNEEPCHPAPVPPTEAPVTSNNAQAEQRHDWETSFKEVIAPTETPPPKTPIHLDTDQSHQLNKMIRRSKVCFTDSHTTHSQDPVSNLPEINFEFSFDGESRELGHSICPHVVAVRMLSYFWENNEKLMGPLSSSQNENQELWALVKKLRARLKNTSDMVEYGDGQLTLPDGKLIPMCGGTASPDKLQTPPDKQTKHPGFKMGKTSPFKNNRLMQAFKQAVSIKKMSETSGITIKKPTLSKLSAGHAAKKPAPRSAKPLFRPGQQEVQDTNQDSKPLQFGTWLIGAPAKSLMDVLALFYSETYMLLGNTYPGHIINAPPYLTPNDLFTLSIPTTPSPSPATEVAIKPLTQPTADTISAEYRKQTSWNQPEDMELDTETNVNEYGTVTDEAPPLPPLPPSVPQTMENEEPQTLGSQADQTPEPAPAGRKRKFTTHPVSYGPSTGSSSDRCQEKKGKIEYRVGSRTETRPDVPEISKDSMMKGFNISTDEGSETALRLKLEKSKHGGGGASDVVKLLAQRSASSTHDSTNEGKVFEDVQVTPEQAPPLPPEEEKPPEPKEADDPLDAIPLPPSSKTASKKAEKQVSSKVKNSNVPSGYSSFDEYYNSAEYREKYAEWKRQVDEYQEHQKQQQSGQYSYTATTENENQGQTTTYSATATDTTEMSQAAYQYGSNQYPSYPPMWGMPNQSWDSTSQSWSTWESKDQQTDTSGYQGTDESGNWSDWYNYQGWDQSANWSSEQYNWDWQDTSTTRASSSSNQRYWNNEDRFSGRGAPPLDSPGWRGRAPMNPSEVSARMAKIARQLGPETIQTLIDMDIDSTEPPGTKHEILTPPGVTPDPPTQTAPGKDIRYYLYNQAKPIVNGVGKFLDFMGAKHFDPMAIRDIVMYPGLEVMVLLHAPDVDDLGKIPNLLELKKRPYVQFALFRNVFDVKMREYLQVMERGGKLMLDSASLLKYEPKVFERLCDNLSKQTGVKGGCSWKLSVHQSGVEQLIAEKDRDEQNFHQLNNLHQILQEYEGGGLVEIMERHDCDENCQSMEVHLACVLQRLCHVPDYRHCLYISDEGMGVEVMQKLNEAGIGVMSTDEFLTKFVPDLKRNSTPNTSTGKESARVIKSRYYIDRRGASGKLETSDSSPPT